jgi:MFS family permease
VRIAPEQADLDESPFRDTVRRLPGQVWIISFGTLVNQVGNFLPVFIVLYLTGRGYSAGTVGVVLGVAGLGRMLGSAIGGYLADKLGRRWIIALSSVVTAGLTALVPSLQALPIVVVVGLIGVTSQIYRPAATAVLLDAVSGNQQRLAAFGVYRFAQNVGSALAGVVGGALASTSYRALFLSNAAACLLFGVIVAILLRGAPEPSSGQDDADEQTDQADSANQARGYRQALADRALVRYLLMTIFGEFVYIQSTVSLPLHVHYLGLSPSDFGLLIGLNGLLVLLLELPITSQLSRYRPVHVLAVGNLILGVGLALTGIATNMVLLLGTVVIWSFGEMISTSSAQAYLGSLAPRQLVGRYLGLYGIAYTIGTGSGPLVGGAVYAISPRALWTLVGVAGLLAAWFSLPGRRTASTCTTHSTRCTGSRRSPIR